MPAQLGTEDDMSRLVRISTVQLPTKSEADQANRKAANVETACAMLEEVGRRKSDIAMLGEVFSTFGVHHSAESIGDIADPEEGETMSQLAQVARRHNMHIIAPVVGLCGGVLRNCARVLGRDGSLLGHYHKVHLTDGEMEWGLAPGEEWPVFNLDFGAIGIMTCHDNSFPESARILMLNGAEVIFWPHVQSGWGDEIWDVQLKARAIDNGVWLVSSSYGTSAEEAWKPGMLVGRSEVLDPHGLVLAGCGRRPGVATAEVDLDAPRLAHSFCRAGEWDFKAEVLRHRRPDMYKALCERIRK